MAKTIQQFEKLLRSVGEDEILVLGKVSKEDIANISKGIEKDFSKYYKSISTGKFDKVNMWIRINLDVGRYTEDFIKENNRIEKLSECEPTFFYKGGNKVAYQEKELFKKIFEMAFELNDELKSKIRKYFDDHATILSKLDIDYILHDSV